jgi:phage portal protein BeeE
MNINNLVKDFKTIWLGTDRHFDEQIIQPLLYGNKRNEFTDKDSEKISTVTNCCKKLADTLSLMPVNVYKSTESGNLIDTKNNLNYLLSVSPDNIITSHIFFNSLEYNRDATGNAFAIIHKYPSGKVKSLELIPSFYVQPPKMIRGQLYYKIARKKENGKIVEETINSMNMLHFKMFSKDGLWGMSPVTAQRLNMSSLYKSNLTADNFWTNNAHTPAFLKSNIQQGAAQKGFDEAVKKSKPKFKPRQIGAAGFVSEKTIESLTNQINDIIKIIISKGYMVDIYNIKLFNCDNDVLNHYYKLKLVVKRIK